MTEMHGGEEDRFEIWETENKERGRLRVHLGLGLEKTYYLYFFFLSVGLVEPVRFNQFQTLETEIESNRNFFCDFLIG
jgi:hypothetical protein